MYSIGWDQFDYQDWYASLQDDTWNCMQTQTAFA